MTLLQASETVLTGRWLFVNGKIDADDVCKRIIDLTSSDLVRVRDHSQGWKVLYRDLHDSRFWELSYPQGHLQGGGPPELKYLTAEEAHLQYSL